MQPNSGYAIVPAPKKDRTQIRQTALGYIAETYPVTNISANVALSAQALRATAIGLRAGDIVTNIIVSVNVAAGGTAGVIFVGLLDSTYNKLLISADVNASFTTTGNKVLALTAPYTVTADGLFYCVINMTTAFGTTQPSIGSSGQTGISGAIGANPKPNWVQTSQATIPTTATPADTSAAPWFAVS